MRGDGDPVATALGTDLVIQKTKARPTQLNRPRFLPLFLNQQQ